MKAEFLHLMSKNTLLHARDAYVEIMGIYEDMCDGPRGAMAYREYFSIRDTIAAIDKELRTKGGV